ncbi:hypothetical protein [Streptomyces sp. YGL11-2]|uniref:hypothetical protein n=1 Tax=Streptomyces sp. YGL11-2 TaxID=3414028 RepID=UPI003CF0583E
MTAAHALAATVAPGGASAALAGGRGHYGRGPCGGCSPSVAVVEDPGPVHDDGYGGAGREHGKGRDRG